MMHGTLLHSRALAAIRCLAAAILVFAALRPAVANKETHTYTDAEQVVVWTDKVGPYNNPQETYKYDTLGLCELQGDVSSRVEQADLTIGEALEGHEFFSSPRLHIEFGKEQPKTSVCNMVLTAEQAQSLSSMVHDNYWYQLYIDDLPIWAFVGEHSKFGVDVSRFAHLLHNNKTAGAPAAN